MSSSQLPPQLIHVKRKRRLHDDDNAQPAFLRVEEEGDSKRRQSGVWLYQRRDAAVTSGGGAGRFGTDPQPRVQGADPVIRVSGPAAELSGGKAAETKPTATGNTVPNEHDHGRAVSKSSAITKPASPQKPAARSEPRRFHLLRREVDAQPGSVLHGGVSKRSRYTSAVFVERTSKKQKKTRQKEEAAPIAQVSAEASQPTQHSALQEAVEPTGDPNQLMEVVSSPQRPLKRPGVAKQPARSTDPTTQRLPPELPPSLVNGWDMDMDQLARDMHAYTLEHIGYTIAQQQEEKQRELARSRTANTRATGAAPSSRLRPKAPAKRWAERHPEEAARLAGAAAAATGQSGSDGDNTESEGDEDGDDYIMETYYRVPASALAAAAVPPERVGLLVLNSAPDVEYFYGEGSGSEEEYDEEDEDENAENHYTADYPDDELDSDDEFGRDPYRYQTGNASDTEEYDGDYDCQ